MFTLTLDQASRFWCVYTLTNEAGTIIFIWYSRLGSALGIRDAIGNPNFDSSKPVTFKIHGVFEERRDAQNNVSTWMRANFMPELNRTIRTSHYSMVKCIETGQVYRNQTEAARMLGINQAQLSQHLRRNPGHRTVKGMTFMNVTDVKTQVHAMQWPATPFYNTGKPMPPMPNPPQIIPQAPNIPPIPPVPTAQGIPAAPAFPTSGTLPSN